MRGAAVREGMMQQMQRGWREGWRTGDLRALAGEVQPRASADRPFAPKLARMASGGAIGLVAFEQVSADHVKQTIV